LVQDNLSTHTTASLYEAFPAAEARRLVERFEWHYTPKHGSWLDMAESEHAGTDPGSRRLGTTPQQTSRQGRLAIHNRRRPRQTRQAIPSVRVTRATSLCVRPRCARLDCVHVEQPAEKSLAL